MDQKEEKKSDETAEKKTEGVCVVGGGGALSDTNTNFTFLLSLLESPGFFLKRKQMI